MKHWIMHAPEGDHQANSHDHEDGPDNPDGHPVTEVEHPGQWYERFDREKGEWVRHVPDEHVERETRESEILTMNNLDLYRAIQAMVREEIAAASTAKRKP